MNLRLSLVSDGLHLDGPDKAEPIEKFLDKLIAVLILHNLNYSSGELWMGVTSHESFVKLQHFVNIAHVYGGSGTNRLSYWDGEQRLSDDWWCSWYES